MEKISNTKKNPKIKVYQHVLEMCIGRMLSLPGYGLHGALPQIPHSVPRTPCPRLPPYLRCVMVDLKAIIAALFTAGLSCWLSNKTDSKF